MFQGCSQEDRNRQSIAVTFGQECTGRKPVLTVEIAQLYVKVFLVVCPLKVGYDVTDVHDLPEHRFVLRLDSVDFHLGKRRFGV
ncbi:MAG: hypothetical protein BWX67_02275 [Thermotogae bacterium ADurb.Bin062]|nr:MAG: hypothetical protein BWX67_02275 [Thermotogota bacterium ADurb.Bin062]